MRDIVFETNNENKLFRSIQAKVNAKEDGIIGSQTMSDIGIALGVECYPLTLKMYGMPVIIGNDIVPFNYCKPIKYYDNSMLGTFTYPRAKVPCSIFAIGNDVMCASSCHAFLNKPESVIYKNDKGIFIKRVTSYSELGSGVKWAVGGMGLLNNYNPTAEGFTGAYADVLRTTNHNVLGVKNGKVYGAYCRNMNAQQVNAFCSKMQFDMAIMLDGGGLAAINGTESFAKINTDCSQGSAIQFI